MLYRTIVWLHITAACAWVGGILFFSLVLVPVLRATRAEHAREMVVAVGRRFRVVGWCSLGVLVTTGIANVLFRASLPDLMQAAFWLSPWGQLLGLKLLLVLLTLGISLAHDRLGSRAARASHAPRGPASLLGRSLGVLALLVLFDAVLLVRGW